LSTTVLGIALIGFLVVMFAIGFWARGMIHTAEDYLVAGRKLPLSLAWATLLATWFGAGTILTATDEVRAEGLRAAALEPIGAGLCLIVAGFFFARRLWSMKLLTLPEFYGRRFGAPTEVLASLIMIPGYFGWIAAQYVALAGVLDLFFGIPLVHGIWIVALVGTGYTLLGGMWSVTLTDAVQVAILLAGLLVVTGLVLGELGDGDAHAGFARLVRETPEAYLQPVPLTSAGAALDWLAVLAVGALGNLPGQDLLQRIFAAKSARVARWACLLAGGAYLTFGALPLILGLSARILLPGDTSSSILPALAYAFLSPPAVLVFILALVSAVLSTIDSAVLAPAGVLAQNVFPRFDGGRFSSLARNRFAVVLVTAASVGMAFAGQDAYRLLEDAYTLPLVGLFVPLALALRRQPRHERSALASMVVGCGLWGVHQVTGWETFLGPALGAWLPSSLVIVVLALVAYLWSESGAASSS
jgi:solute:Na+ symporter, SSS family